MPSYKDWKDRIEEKSDNETSFRLETDPVSRGERWCAQRIAIKNETHDSTDLTVAVRRVGYDHVIDWQETPTASEWYISRDPIYLLEGEKLVAIFTGTTTDDKCKMHITGYKESIK